jgi:hypothetical protein
VYTWVIGGTRGVGGMPLSRIKEELMWTSEYFRIIMIGGELLEVDNGLDSEFKKYEKDSMKITSEEMKYLLKVGL